MQNKALVDEIIDELYKRLEQKVTEEQVIVIGPMPTSDLKVIDEVYGLTPYKEGMRGCHGILITQLSVEMLSHLALACPVTEEEKFVLKALLQDKPLYVLDEGVEYRSYKKQAHKTLYALLMTYEDKIKKYGISFIGHLDELQAAKACETVGEGTVKGDVRLDMTYKKLLLESDLIKKHIEGICTVVITKKCIITPLAEDYIKKRHICIQRE